MLFTIQALNPNTKELQKLYYDNDTSSLTYEDGKSVVPVVEVAAREAALRTSRENPNGKTTPKVLKISLGLSCNYECEYCSQRFVPRADETNPDNVAAFLDGLDAWVKEEPENIQFWGGEPFVYIKTMRPLADRLREKYPNSRFSVVTNGSLLTTEINEWLDKMGFIVAVSHDGPGQSVRGPDPLEDPDKKAAIMDLYNRLAPQGRMTFNAMLNRENTSKAAVQKFFIELTGDPAVGIGEGGFVDAYDDGGMGLSLKEDEFIAFRNQSFAEIRNGEASNITGARDRLMGFINSIRTARPSIAVGQKCSMDDPDNIAVDLNGNVLTCQNVSIATTSFNGESHKIGHVSDFENIKLKTATHWSHRKDCSSCPVLHICQGACMFLEGPMWDASCDNAFSDTIPIFAAGIEFLTGLVPVYIDGGNREDRKDIFGLVNGAPEPKKPKKPFPIPVVAY